VSDKQPSDPALLEAALNAASTMSSDYEVASFLSDVLKQNGVEGSARVPFFKAVASLGSGYERGRVLQTIVKNPSASNDTVREVLRASTSMSGYELSQLLQLIARTHTVTGDLREAYLTAADRLSGYEQSQVFAALVKNERARK
jgi:hypothetical protein